MLLPLGDRRGTQNYERKVEETDKLVRQTLMHLSRDYSANLVGQAAHDDLLELKPRLQEALEVIDGHRNLTEEEIARRHAFRMLLKAALLL